MCCASFTDEPRQQHVYEQFVAGGVDVMTVREFLQVFLAVHVPDANVPPSSGLHFLIFGLEIISDVLVLICFVC